MLTTRTNRLDPSLIPEEALAQLAKVFAVPDHVALIDAQGNRTHIPEVLFAHFARIVRLMSEKKAIVMVPEDEAFTTQAAANYLGMSRQYIVGLLEKGEIAEDGTAQSLIADADSKVNQFISAVASHEGGQREH
jgi:ABC-type histidine transport system ATPase subunit